MRRQRGLSSICDWLSINFPFNFINVYLILSSSSVATCFLMFQDGLMYFFFRFLLQNSKKGKITLENISKLPVDNLNISVSSKDGKGKSSFHSTVHGMAGEGSSFLPYKSSNKAAGQISRRFYHCYKKLL